VSPPGFDLRPTDPEANTLTTQPPRLMMANADRVIQRAGMAYNFLAIAICTEFERMSG